ncbi:MAG: hypothetical protein NTW87_11940 [Planctomycetota bacterium]|nr:hypothetical protein [Planctomycetota bacterium]
MRKPHHNRALRRLEKILGEEVQRTIDIDMPVNDAYIPIARRLQMLAIAALRACSDVEFWKGDIQEIKRTYVNADLIEGLAGTHSSAVVTAAVETMGEAAWPKLHDRIEAEIRRKEWQDFVKNAARRREWEYGLHRYEILREKKRHRSQGSKHTRRATQ